MKKQKKQPKIKRGSTFIGWAIYNWGICYQNVFRTRKEAQKYCATHSSNTATWKDVKPYMRVVKVKCIVIDKTSNTYKP